LQDPSFLSVRDAVNILVCLNPDRLRAPMQWHAYVWRRRRHWAVVFSPDTGNDFFTAHVDIEILRSRSKAASGSGEGNEDELDSQIQHFPSNELSIVFELLVPLKGDKFFLEVSVHRSFNPEKKNVRDFGSLNPIELSEIAEHAIRVINSYRAYGMIGCNCQHFALDFLAELGVDIGVQAPDDKRAVSALESVVKFVSVGNGIAKGACLLGTGGALGLTGHVALGVAVGCAGSLMIRKGYKYVCTKHRKPHADENVEEASPEMVVED